MKKVLQERLKWFQEAAEEMGVDWFPIQWEVVPEEVLLEVMTYGLPTRARHWHYGQSYEYQKASGEMGMSKVYELILNNNPSFAFLLDTNSDIANTMVIAHCIGHSAFFKENYLFQGTDRKMVYHAAERARRVDEYIDKYGLERVEYVMDVGFALEKHIDWQKGVHRKPYGRRRRSLIKRPTNEFEDLLGDADAPAYKTVIKNRSFPPQPERDLLWFISNYATLEPWEKDVLEIIREESFYFYPQYLTKIMNEGFASYMHAELMYLLPQEMLSHAEYLEFVKIHERVVQPGRSKLNINPYFLGFTIFNDIKEKWDKLHEAGKSDITGFQKMLEVVREEDDISFLRNYLTQEICDKLGLFAYTKKWDKRREEYIQVESKHVDHIVEHMISGLYNYRAPVISITHATQMGLELEHESANVGSLDPKHTRQVMKYLFNIWNGTVDLKTSNKNGEVFHYTYDEAGFSHHDEDDDTIVPVV